LASHKVGVISDTHGLLRAEALDALAGVDHILHAGDVGDPVILEQLREVAAVSVVRGNVDHGPWATELPWTEVFEIGGHALFMLHDRADLDLDPVAAGISAVIYGHSHQPLIEWRDEVLFLNPGSAGPRRFRLPVSVALLDVSAGGLEPTLVPLDV
jgi:putative phosphoesterase